MSEILADLNKQLDADPSATQFKVNNVVFDLAGPAGIGPFIGGMNSRC
jgi:hypothetical protein